MTDSLFLRTPQTRIRERAELQSGIGTTATHCLVPILLPISGSLGGVMHQAPCLAEQLASELLTHLTEQPQAVKGPALASSAPASSGRRLGCMYLLGRWCWVRGSSPTSSLTASDPLLGKAGLWLELWVKV